VHPVRDAVKVICWPGFAGEASFALLAPSVNEQGAPASVTVYVLPAIVRCPVRGFAPGFGCAMNCTSAEPAEPEVLMVNHESLLVDNHVQAPGATTLAVPTPPPAGTDPLEDLSE
jgi:hypothetical protein